MSKCFQEGSEAYTRGDGARAKEMSNKGKEHQRKMEEYNKQASDWIFKGMCLNSLSFVVAISLTSYITANNLVRPSNPSASLMTH
jgi:Domain of unknown function (DUF1771)